MARYLLDSNAFLKFKESPQTLRKEARETIEDTANQLFVSLASLWELAIKAAKGKLPYHAALIAGGPEALVRSLRESSFQLLPIDLAHALTSARLMQHHGDPFDRMLIAQALEENLILITSDRTMPFYPGLKVLKA